MLLESDFSQLEVVGLAALTRDPMLISDLLEGRDMHTHYTIERFAKRGIELTPDTLPPGERFKTKRMTFQLQYGSGAANMAKKMGMDKDDCQTFIDVYYDRYKEVKRWQEQVAQEVYDSRKPSDLLTPSGQPQGIGVYDSPTGRRYTFFEQDPPDWKKDRTPSFSPTQLKNYPVQGSATADIMAVFRARLYRAILVSDFRDDVVLINTVHDSIMADCRNMEAALKLKHLNETIAASLQEVMASTWGFICPVPFKIETKAGSRWSNMEKI